MPFSKETTSAMVKAQLDAFDKMVEVIKADTQSTEVERSAMTAEVLDAKTHIAAEEDHINEELPAVVAAHAMSGG
jgi:hypothetical protein